MKLLLILCLLVSTTVYAREYPATLKRVVDGDTVDLIVDLGFNIVKFERFRLYGINAPETRTRDLEEKKRGLIAKQWLIDRLATMPIIYIDTLDDRKGKFGRYLANILDPNSVYTINEIMVINGLAVEYMKD